MTSPLSPSDIFDRRQRALRDARSRNELPFMPDLGIKKLFHRLHDVRRVFPRALLIGRKHSPDLIENLRSQVKIDDLCLFNPSSTSEETIPFEDKSFDLVMSSFELHSLNDLPGFLIQIKNILKPDGFFLAVLPGGRTLHELRTCLMEAELAITGGASPRIMPFAGLQSCASLMQRAGFALPVVDSDIVTLTYDHALRLMADLRAAGETNILHDRPRHFTRRAVLTEAARIYAEKFTGSDGRIETTVEMIFLAGWAPHDSQQKPKRPGSATIKLADALMTEEIGTGDKTQPR